MHITLQFLGDVKSANLPRLANDLTGITKLTAGFDLELSGVGCFSSRVLWAGIGAGSDSLNRLAHAVRGVATRLGAHDEKREFNAHVTLGRFREPTRGVSALLREKGPPPFGQFRVGQVELIRSELSPKGSRYTTLESFILSGKPQ
jgi:2'-5' RNA ligase